jgi:threonine aldolase
MKNKELFKEIHMFDFRSDTVTRPTQAMKEAMMNAQVGDDVYGDDPSINALERYVAYLTGFEDALFVVSGTMGNQLAVMCHTSKGESVLMHKHVHINRYEVGAIGLLSSVYPKLIENEIGYLRKEDLILNFTPDNIHFPKISTIIVENALSDGRVVDMSTMNEVITQAHQYGYKVHMDGARIFNACIALNVDIKDITNQADSLMFCLSKGLGAPVGSLLCGSKAFIAQARRYRKMLGGGIRQGGFLAAAGHYALEHHILRLKEDHQRAQEVADMLVQFGYEVLSDHRDINMVFFKLKPDQDEASWCAKAKEFNLLISGSSYGLMRIVTHLDIDDEALMLMHQFLSSF